MTAHGDYALSLEELSTTLAAYAGPARPRTREARRSWISGRLALAVALVAMLIAGCSYAIGFDPFRGLSAADHPAGPSDKLPAALLDLVNHHNFRAPRDRMVLSTARFVRRLSNGMRFYTIATKGGTLCIGTVHEPKWITPHATVGGTFDCGYSLHPTEPITESIWDNSYYRGNREMHGTQLSYGLAWDGITAISWGSDPRDPPEPTVTTPVRGNVWVHLGPLPEGKVTLHLDDGTTQRLWRAPFGDGLWHTFRPACSHMPLALLRTYGLSPKWWCYQQPKDRQGPHLRAPQRRRSGSGTRHSAWRVPR